MKSVIIYSGGMDSYTLLRDVMRHDDLTAISFNYNQRHSRELELASRVCERYSIPHHIVDLTSLSALLPGSSLTDNSVDVPEGHYEEESMKLTVVPNRNMIMLSIAAAHALAIGADRLLYGAHAGDHAIYPDCRKPFVNAVERAVAEGNYGILNIEAPFMWMDKGQILDYGRTIGLTAEDYKDTHTCYKGEALACGKCGACQERIEAFASVGWVDPVPYEVEIAS